MKIAFVVPYPHGVAPSQRFRFEQYLNMLEKSGHSVKQYAFLSENAWPLLYVNGKTVHKMLYTLWGYFKRIFQLIPISKAQIVFIHREASPLGPPVFEWFITKILRKSVIYDFDDSIWLPNTSESNSWISSLKFHKKVYKIAKWSKRISVGNKYLADFISEYNSNVVINPTTIDTSYHIPNIKPASNRKTVLGWTGTHSTLKYLEEILPTIDELASENNLKLIVISNIPPASKYSWIDYRPWSIDLEISDLAEIDIGIMPLIEDDWSKGKCGFKLLQYMSMGIPSIASPVGINQKLIEESESGFLYTDVESLKSAVQNLLANPDLKASMGENGRKYIEQNYSVDSNKSDFLLLFDL